MSSLQFPRHRLGAYECFEKYAKEGLSPVACKSKHPQTAHDVRMFQTFYCDPWHWSSSERLWTLSASIDSTTKPHNKGHIRSTNHRCYCLAAVGVGRTRSCERVRSCMWLWMNTYIKKIHKTLLSVLNTTLCPWNYTSVGAVPELLSREATHTTARKILMKTHREIWIGSHQNVVHPYVRTCWNVLISLS